MDVADARGDATRRAQPASSRARRPASQWARAHQLHLLHARSNALQRHVGAGEDDERAFRRAAGRRRVAGAPKPLGGANAPHATLRDDAST